MDLSAFKFNGNGKQIPLEYRERVLQDVERLRGMIKKFEVDPQAELCVLMVCKDGEGHINTAEVACGWEDTAAVFLLAMVDMSQRIGEEKKRVLREEYLKKFVQRG